MYFFREQQKSDGADIKDGKSSEKWVWLTFRKINPESRRSKGLGALWGHFSTNEVLHVFRVLWSSFRPDTQIVNFKIDTIFWKNILRPLIKAKTKQ